MDSELAAVKRTMRILELLADHPEGMGVTELAAQLAVNKASVSRILATLQKAGYVSQDERTRLFSLGWRLVALAYRFADSLPLEEAARPVLRELAQKTGELVQLAVVDGEELLFVAKAEGARPLRVASMLGKAAPLHATAVGKVWLASLPEARVLEILARKGMPRITEHTITDPMRLLEELRQVRAQGYALAREEVNPTVVGVAAAVPPDGPAVRAALVVAIPAFEATEARIGELAAACRQAAGTLAARLAFWFA